MSYYLGAYPTTQKPVAVGVIESDNLITDYMSRMTVIEANFENPQKGARVRLVSVGTP